MPRAPGDLHFSFLKKEETVCEAGAEPQTVVREGSRQKGSNSEAAEGGLGAGAGGTWARSTIYTTLGPGASKSWLGHRYLNSQSCPFLCVVGRGRRLFPIAKTMSGQCGLGGQTRKGLREAPFGRNHQWAQVLQIHPKSAITDSRSPYPRLCCWALHLKPLHPLARLGTGGSVTIAHVEEEVWGCRTQLKGPWVLRKETARLSASGQEKEGSLHL